MPSKMTGQSVKFQPGNLVYRQVLRGVERRKYPKGTGAKMAGMRLMGVKTSLKKSCMTRNWTQLDQSAEEGLTLVPWDAELNADAGEATANLGFVDVAVQCYRWAVESAQQQRLAQIVGNVAGAKGRVPRSDQVLGPGSLSSIRSTWKLARRSRNSTPVRSFVTATLKTSKARRRNGPSKKSAE